MAVRSPLRRRRPQPEAAADTESKAIAYDAFISYSHAVDGRLAPALQSALQRFSKPWYRLRALRIFRDNASLSANPALGSSIESALGASRWFILLASPGSAQSPWVAREVETWLGAHGTDRLLIAVTDGELVWDDATGAFRPRPETAVPESLLAAFAEEPRFIDLRWARTGEHLSPSDPRFRDAVADLAAPIHDRPKDDLVGEDVRQHRRAVRLARAGVATLVVLLVAAAAAAVLAVSQRNEARTQRTEAELQRDRAEEEARIATSRQLAAQATAVRDEQYDLALLLAVEAYRTRAHARGPKRALVHAGVQPASGRLRRPAGAATRPTAGDGRADARRRPPRGRRRARGCALGHEHVRARPPTRARGRPAGRRHRPGRLLRRWNADRGRVEGWQRDGLGDGHGGGPRHGGER